MKLNVSKLVVMLIVVSFVLSGVVMGASKASQYMQYGVKMLKAKKYNKAVQYLKYSLKMERSSNAYYYLGLAYYGLKNKSQALKNFQAALKVNPENSKAKSMVSRLSGGGSSGGSSNARKYLVAGHKYLKAKRYDAAIKYYKRSAQIKPTYQAYQFMGTAYYYKGDKANAKRAYQKSLQINSDNPGVRRMLSKLGGEAQTAGGQKVSDQLGVHPLLMAGLFAGSLAVLFFF